MRYGFINNFSQTLAAELAAGATTLTLSAGGEAFASASTDYRYKLTLVDIDESGEEVHYEIVDVTGRNGNELTVVREQEGTTALSPWPADTLIEARLTASAAGKFLVNLGPGDDDDENLAIGPYASIDDSGGEVWGAVALGGGAYVNSPGGIAVGQGADAKAGSAVSIGRFAEASGTASVALGSSTNATALRAIAIGSSVFAYAQDAIVMGNNAQSYHPETVAIGRQASAYYEGTVNLGRGASSGIIGGLQIAALPALASPTSNFYSSSFANSTYLNAARAVLQTGNLDLTSSASFHIQLPADALLYIDDLEFIVTSSSTPGGTPEITVGTTAAGDDILAATALTADSLHARQKLPAFSAATGVANVHVTISTTGSGTWQGRLIVHGFVLEV